MEMKVKNWQRYHKKQIENNFPWFTLLITEMRSKCSKLCSETTCLQLVVHLSFEYFDVISKVEFESTDHGKLFLIC